MSVGDVRRVCMLLCEQLPVFFVVSFFWYEGAYICFFYIAGVSQICGCCCKSWGGGGND